MKKFRKSSIFRHSAVYHWNSMFHENTHIDHLFMCLNAHYEIVKIKSMKQFNKNSLCAKYSYM